MIDWLSGLLELLRLPSRKKPDEFRADRVAAREVPVPYDTLLATVERRIAELGLPEPDLTPSFKPTVRVRLSWWWSRELEDLHSKLLLGLALFVVAVLPAALLEFFGLTRWIVLPLFLVTTAGVCALWLGAKLHDETGPWKLQAHVKRIGDEVQRERTPQPAEGPTVATPPAADVVDLTAYPTHVLEVLARFLSPLMSGRQQEGGPPHHRPDPPGPQPPLALQ